SPQQDAVSRRHRSVCMALWDELMQRKISTEQLLIKKLSRNDCSWADSSNHHQSGVYIPKDVQGFFPPLINVNSAKPHIYEAKILTLWIDSGEERESRLKHYSNEGAEL